MYRAPTKIPVVFDPDPSQPDPKLLKSGQKLPAREVLNTIVVRSRAGLLTTGARTENAFRALAYTRSNDWSAGVTMGVPMGHRFVDPEMRQVTLEQAERNVELTRFFEDHRSAGPRVFSFGGLSPDGLPPPRLPLSFRLQSQFGVNGLGSRLDTAEMLTRVENSRVLLSRAQSLIRQGHYEEARVLALKMRELDPSNVTADAMLTIVNLKRNLEKGSRLPERREDYFIRAMNDAEEVSEYVDGFRTPTGFDKGFHSQARQRKGNVSVEDFAAGLMEGARQKPSLLYERPRYHDDPSHYADLLAYAPGLDTSGADTEAVLEAEAIPDTYSRPGKIDAKARVLLDKARATGWQSWKIGEGNAGCNISFDGQGRYAYERVLPPGLKERVVCDGKTLLHLYPQFGLAAHRTVSRFHRADFARFVPWVVPPAEDLARGADLRLVGERTVAIVPHGADEAKAADGKPATYARVHLLFAEDGRLTERHVILMPKGETLLRQVCTAAGEVRVLDGKGKELLKRAGTLAPSEAPALKPSTKRLVVVPLPYRASGHVRKALKIESKATGQLRFDEALPLLAAYVGERNASQAQAVFQQAFAARDQ
jgi:hypothetical protein